MEGKIIRKYRQIFSRIPRNTNTIKDLSMFLNGHVIICDDHSINISYQNLLQKTTHVDWLRSCGVRTPDITFNNKTICADITFCSYLQSIIEFCAFLKNNNVSYDFFHKSIYSTEHSRDLITETKYKIL